MKSQLLLTIVLLLISLSINAEITTDGTLGSRAHLPGPDYQIGADLGQQHGGNLFHSFQDFNLSSPESATFSGPNNVSNVISRVTGGNSSNIDGLIRSTMPNADMYFLNPYGIMFGPHAQLDVQGSFHASTADYLRLGEGGRFDARNPSDSLLTVAPIESFGFLTDIPATITTQDSMLIVPYGKTLSLMGGDLSLSGHSPITFDEQVFMAISAQSILSAPGGRINLASVSSSGEIVLSELGLALNAEGGQISMEDTLIETSGIGSGAVFIRGGQLVMNNAVIQTQVRGNENGKVIDLKLNESIHISGENIALNNTNLGSGDAGNIVIETPYLDIDGSFILTNSYAQGNSGNIDINSRQIKINNGTRISCSAYGIGQCGNVNLKVTDTLSILGAYRGNYIQGGTLYINYPTGIFSTALGGAGGQLYIEAGQINIVGGVIATASFGKADSGDIVLHADSMSLTNGGFISSSGFSSGQVGNIDIHVVDTLSLSGRRKGLYITPIDVGFEGAEFEDNQTNISSFGLASSGGSISISASTLKIDNEAGIGASTLGNFVSETNGNINIEVDNLSITQGGFINNSNGILLGRDFFAGPGQGGNIQIQARNIRVDANETVLPTGIFSDTYSSGTGGNIEIQANHLTIANNGAISARSNDTGNAGSLTVQADTIKLTHYGKISTEAENAAGGNLLVKIHHLLYLRSGEMTTSVGTGKGQGGDILIENPTFVLLNQGKIKAQADEGQGGNIRIAAEQFIASPESLVSASSRLGLDGEINIDSPTVDMDAFMVILPGGYVEAQLKHCTTEEIENPSTFKIDLSRKRTVPFFKLK